MTAEHGEESASWLSEWGARGVVCLMLLWAMSPSNPYTYYTLLRWVTCGLCEFLAMRAHERELTGWTWVLAGTALLYNPIGTVHLNREIWSFVNVATVAVLVLSVKALRPDSGES